MNRDDEAAIESVLTGLRQAKPDFGLEERIQRSLERRQIEAASMQRPHALSRWMRPAWVLAAAVAIFGAVLGFALHHRGQSVKSRSGAAADAAALHVLPPQEPTSMLGQTQTGERLPETLVAHGQGNLTVQHPARRSALYRHQMFDTFAAEHVPAARLPSAPVPVPTLTEQERLLLRIAPHAGSLPLLNEAKREEIARADAKDFQDYFKPSELEEKINAEQIALLTHTN
jgi:hypothetical protein